MDTLWDKNTLMSEAIGRFGGDEKIKMTTQNLQKSNAKKNNCKSMEKMCQNKAAYSGSNK